MEEIQSIETGNTVKGLLKKAFGEKCEGDWWNFGFLLMPASGPDSPLGTIVKPRLFGLFPEHIGFFECAQNLGEEPDGSVIRIRQKYIVQARRYAELYKEETGKEVTVIPLY